MKQQLNRLKCAVIAALTMGLALRAQAELVNYVDVGGTTKQVDATVVTASGSRVTWNAGWYVVNSTITITGGASCSGAVNLILADGASLTISGVAQNNAGITVTGSGNSLVIYGQSAGTGALAVTGGNNAAGIGGGNNAMGSNITINGGMVTATGADCGAGIGGGSGGNGSDITVNGGSVVAIGGQQAAGIGGGFQGTGSNITINNGKVSVCGIAIYLQGGSNYVPDIIGNGVTNVYSATAPARGNVIGASAEVRFDLTGIFDGDERKMSSEPATTPGGFEGMTILMPEVAMDRVLVGGCANWSAASVFTLSNAVSGATKSLEVNGAEESFSLRFCTLAHDGMSLKLAVRPPVLTITQQPNAANGYTIVATTDGDQGITNYTWKVRSMTGMDYAAMKGVQGSGIYSGEFDDSISGVTAIENGGMIYGVWPTGGLSPSDGEFRFTCTATISGDPFSGKLTQPGKNEWKYVPSGSFGYVLSLSSNDYTDFSISNLRWVKVVDEPVAEGETMTEFPSDKGVAGSNYLCSVTYAHADVSYTDDSEVFEYSVIAPTIEYTAPVYVGNVASNGIAYWTTNSVIEYTIVTSATSAVTWGEAGVTNWYVVKDANVQIDGGVTCAGHVNLILCEGAKLVVTNVPTGCAGIATDSAGSFTVYGQPDGAGELEVYAGNWAAGIGGGHYADGKYITINGGRVKAVGGFYGAGIGGGDRGGGSHIAINGGVVTASCVIGGMAACIGGGNDDAVSSDIVLNAGKVYLANPQWSELDEINQGPFIGADVEDGRVSGVIVSKDVDVLFNMTGKFRCTSSLGPDIGVWTEPQVDMPADFKGLVLLVSDTLASYGVGGRFYLANGLGDWTAATTFTITNAQTGATDEIDIGERMSFASTYTRLFREDDALIFTLELPELWIDQQPNVTNGYAVVARTDGNKGITNYIWSIKSEAALGAEVLVDRAYESDYGEVKDNTIKCYVNTTYGEYYVDLMWLVEGNTYSLPGIPPDGELHFTCPLDLSESYDTDYGVLTRGEGTDEWVWTPIWVDTEGTRVTEFCVVVDKSFEMKDVQWVYTGFTPVAEGADLTAFPVGNGVAGETYQCELVYAHYNTTCIGESEPFIFLGSVGAIPTPVEHTTWAVYTNGFLSVEDDGIWAAWTNETATVVYTAEDGYVFADGATVVTNTFDTTKNPATADAPDAPFIPVASVTTNGVTTFYGDIDTAWNEANGAAGSTLMLLTDIALTSQLATWEDADFIFDLNGKTLSAGDFNDSLIKHAYGLLTIESGSITGALASAVMCSADLVVRNVTFDGNYAEAGGAAIYVNGCSVNVYGSTFRQNRVDEDGGAIFADNNARLLLKDCLVTENQAGQRGGGIYKLGADTDQYPPVDKCVLIGTTVVGNTAGTTGGGVYYAKARYNSCLAAGTLISMADGTFKKVEEVVEGDLVRTFDHEGGTNSTAAVYLNFTYPDPKVPFTLVFDGGPGANGTLTLSLTCAHSLLEKTSRKYVRVNEADAASYIGKSFYGEDGQWHELVDVTFGTEPCDWYSLYTAHHVNAFANGLLQASTDVDCYLNLYELDENLKADPVQLQADIDAYGLFDFDEIPEEYGMDRDWFDASNGKYNYVIIGKGLATYEYFEGLATDLEEDYAEIAAMQETEPKPALMKVMAAPMTAAVPNVEPTVDDFASSVLTLGAGTVVTNNIADGNTSNIYLANDGEGSKSLIALAETHDGISAGVACEWTSGQFTVATNATVEADTMLFTSDNPELVARYDGGGKFLKLGYTGIQVGDDAWARIVVGTCTVVGTGDMWSYDKAGASPLWGYRSAITNLVVSDGVTSVGSRFFENMWYLQDVSLGADVTNVAARAFKKCYGLTNVTSVASGVQTIGDYVFSGCHSLQAMTFADTPTFGTESYSLQAAIYMDGDIPIIYPIPRLKVGEQATALRIKGKQKLGDADWTDVTEMADAERKTYHFFKVVMP